MELFKIKKLGLQSLFLLCLSTSAQAATFPPDVSAQVLYFMHHGQADKAFNRYLTYSKEINAHDHELLQQAASTLLEEGSNSSDPEIQLMCLFGAGVSTNPTLLPVLEKGLQSKELKLQMAALNFLSKFQDDAADHLIVDLLSSSPFLLARLQALFLLAQKKNPQTLGFLQSLLLKVPPLARVLFPQIIVQLESTEATTFLRQFFSDPSPSVRCEAILQAAEKGMDDLLPTLRAMATHPDPIEQESCAIALTLLKDEHSLPLFQKWVEGKHESVRLAALKGLMEFGEGDAKKQIENEVKNKNLFAFSLLDDDSSSKALLQALLKDPDNEVRLNTQLRLLEFKELGSLESLKEVLIRNERDNGFSQQFSPAHGLHAWKIIPHATQKEKIYPGIGAQTLHLRESALRMTLELPEEDFLKVARLIFEQRQTDLIPLLMQLLINQKSPAVIALLKEQQQKTGAPFIRTYCTLALYRLQEKGPYEGQLLRWVQEVEKTELIRFRDEELSEEKGNYQLTPEETSQLLIEAFESLASAQNQVGIEALLHAIAYGNPKNRYALAGLLMRTSE